MIIRRQKINVSGIRFSVKDGQREVGRAYLYILKNDLHREPFGFLEDVFVEEKYRRQGLGTALVKAVIAEAKKRGCYKLIATSRYSRKEVHKWYKKFGFKDFGKEFRMDL